MHHLSNTGSLSKEERKHLYPCYVKARDQIKSLESSSIPQRKDKAGNITYSLQKRRRRRSRRKSRSKRYRRRSRRGSRHHG